MRKHSLALALALTVAMSEGLLSTELLRAQTNTGLGSDIPEQEPPQPTNQQLDYRTNQQIFQRRVNNATITCTDNGSAGCNQVAPQVESLQDNEVLNRLQEARQETESGEGERGRGGEGEREKDKEDKGEFTSAFCLLPSASCLLPSAFKINW